MLKLNKQSSSILEIYWAQQDIAKIEGLLVYKKSPKFGKNGKFQIANLQGLSKLNLQKLKGYCVFGDLCII